MNRRTLSTFLLLSILFALNFNSFAQFQKIYDFDSIHGSNPSTTEMLFDGKWFYGTAYTGGVYNKGVIYKIKPNGSNMTVVYSFGQNLQNGYNPYCHLVKSGAFLYGTALFSLTPKKGLVFKVDTNGNNYSILHEFVGGNTDGATPWASLTILGNVLFGTTTYGSLNGYGTVYKINTNGSNYHILHSFDLNPYGANPYCTVTVKDSVLYGVTMNGGLNNKSVFYRIDTSGNNFAKIRDFDSLGGWKPYGEIIILGDSAYGMTSSGGDYNSGVIYKMNLNGSGYQKLHSFGNGTDGKSPFGSLIEFQNTLYGATNTGGTSTFGTLFKIKKDGSQYQKILDFDGGTFGKRPGTGALVLIGGKIYGTTVNGGNNVTKSYGIIFSTDTIQTVITNISETPVKNYKIYPNPAHGNVNIENVSNCEIKVYDITGRLLMINNSENLSQKVSLDLNGFNPGIYFVRIKEQNSTYTGKIILQ
jgi:uncharacterized repeat protein (TIGR03803 family)